MEMSRRSLNEGAHCSASYRKSSRLRRHHYRQRVLLLCCKQQNEWPDMSNMLVLGFLNSLSIHGKTNSSSWMQSAHTSRTYNNRTSVADRSSAPTIADDPAESGFVKHTYSNATYRLQHSVSAQCRTYRNVSAQSRYSTDIISSIRLRYSSRFDPVESTAWVNLYSYRRV